MKGIGLPLGITQRPRSFEVISRISISAVRVDPIGKHAILGDHPYSGSSSLVDASNARKATSGAEGGPPMKLRFSAARRPALAVTPLARPAAAAPGSAYTLGAGAARSSRRRRTIRLAPDLVAAEPGRAAGDGEAARGRRDLPGPLRGRSGTATRSPCARRSSAAAGRGAAGAGSCAAHALPAVPGADRDHARQSPRAVRRGRRRRRRARTSIPGT